MFTIVGDDTVPDFSKVLSYRLTLKHCVTVDNNEPVINIIRIMTKGMKEVKLYKLISEQLIINDAMRVIVVLFGFGNTYYVGSYYYQ